MAPTIEEKLRAVFQGEIDSRGATRDRYARDASLLSVRPELVVYPKHAQDVQNLVRLVSAEKGKHPTLSVTARSAGTDMSGGPLNDSIIADFSKYFTKIHEVSAQRAVLEPGVMYRDFEKETARRGVMLPSYTASKDLCTVGGMVANNAGGEKSIKYGKTERYVTRLKAVFADGNEYEVRPLSKPELDAKMAQDDFEGNLYKHVFELIEESYTAVHAAKPAVSKNSAGYYLWNVWDRQAGIFDLTKLIVGSQGTLCLVTEIEFALVPVPKHSRMVVMYLHSLDRLGEVVDEVMQYGPESFESYDDYSMKLAVSYAADFISSMGFFGALRLGVQFIPDLLSIVTGGLPKLILMVEVTGDDERALSVRAEAIQKAVRRFGFKTQVAKSAAQTEKYWKVRRESFNLLRKHSKGKQTAPFIDDVIVEPRYLPVFLPRLRAILERYQLTYTVAGHAGNGNFHIIPLMDLDSPLSADLILTVSKEVYALVAEYHGSITAEHNDGIIRTPFLSYMFPPAILELFGRVKGIFDPQNIFNPGKKVGGSFDYIAAHVIKGHDTKHGS